MNHLQNEKSPYLQQHREQPVDWYPWGREAFDRAQRENKPIFLSIGYSTCHWCHVMAHEAFEDKAIAAKLNESFISIKVDREERPDIDSLYMRVCTGMNGSGGWPLTIFMTPDQHPFFAATYLPPHALQELLTKIAQAWQQKPDRLRYAGRQIADWLQQAEKSTAQNSSPDAKNLIDQAIQWFQQTYDPHWGGFGRAPKFPSAHNITFLLRAAKYLRKAQKTGEADCLSMVHHTLQKMAQGGLYDQLGGGFSRYSTDEKWLVPHFEKTLYDNALLAMAYSEAGYEEVAAETLDYVLRELTHPEGGFYCGQDADSDGEEGKYYTWTEEEIISVLGEEKGSAFCQTYQIQGSGIPNRIGQPWREEAPMKKEKQRLLDYRSHRCTLGLDDKILTSWNGLMIAAMAQVGFRQGRIDYILAGEKAAGFIRAHLMRTSGRLAHCFRDGEAAHAGQLSDYAGYAYGLVALYHSMQKAEYLLQAVQMAQWMETLFADEAGGYYETAKDGETLIARLKETDDGALPSGNSMAAMVLAELGQLTGERQWREAAEKQSSFLRRTAANTAAGSTFFLQALLLEKYRNQELLCVSAEDTIEPPKAAEDVCVMVKTPANAETLGKAAPFTKNYPIPASGAEYYLCEGGSCQLPVKQYNFPASGAD